MRFYIKIITIIGLSVNSFYYVLGRNWTHDLIEVMLISAFPSRGTVVQQKSFNVIPHQYAKRCKPKIGLVQYPQIDPRFWGWIRARSSPAPRLSVVGMYTCPVFVMKISLSPSCLYHYFPLLPPPLLPSPALCSLFPLAACRLCFHYVLHSIAALYVYVQME